MKQRITGKPVEVKVLESLMKGIERCKFTVKLTEDEVSQVS